MTAGAAVALILGLLALAFVAAPLFRRDAAERERVVAAESELMELPVLHRAATSALSVAVALTV